MKTLAEIRCMVRSAPNAESANKIISDNYDFVTFGEKIAFLKGMFGTEIIGEVNNNSDEATYFDILNTIISQNNRAVKKTLTIPAWLNDMSVKNQINFSQVLQEALMEKLGLK